MSCFGAIFPYRQERQTWHLLDSSRSGIVCGVALQFLVSSKPENDFAKGGTAILGAALGGVAIAFADKLSPVKAAADSIFMYPIGLLVAVPWFYMPEVLKLGDDPNKKGLVRLMYLAIIGTVLITILATGLAFIPSLRALLR